MTGAASLACNKKIPLQVTFDEFGCVTRIVHEFDVNPNPEGIGYDTIIGRDLLTKLKIDIRFSYQSNGRTRSVISGKPNIQLEKKCKLHF